jgi:peptidoglycan/LPS O-acetylase OafA/YrhL
MIWAGTQISFFQFYNPDFLRAYGVGALNGSLWTIPVEMQFYVLTPLLVALFFRGRWLFWTLLALFAAVNAAHTQILSTHAEWDKLRKLSAVTFAPWIYMFMLGAAGNLLWERVRFWVEGRFAMWLAAYSLAIAVNFAINLGLGGNAITLPWVVLLAGLTLSAAFTRPELAERCLRRNDISYGVYIYHMPIFNFAIALGALKAGEWSWLVLPPVFLVAALSWVGVERPALNLKRRTLLARRPVAPEPLASNQDPA